MPIFAFYEGWADTKTYVSQAYVWLKKKTTVMPNRKLGRGITQVQFKKFSRFLPSTRCTVI